MTDALESHNQKRLLSKAWYRLRVKRGTRVRAQNKAPISVIIPIYNGARYIKEAVESIACQTLLPCELILVEDGSNDNSLALVRKMSLPFPVIEVKQRNSGQSCARNRGVAVAQGKYIAFLDQDDRWYPDHLAKLIRPFSQTGQIGWVYSNLDEIDREGSLVGVAILNKLHSKHPKTNLIDMLSYDMFVLPSASLILKEAFQNIGGFDERLRGYEDDDLFVRLFRKGYRNIYIDESLSQWRIYDSSSSFSPTMAKSRRVYAAKLIELFPDDRALCRFWVRDCIAPRFLSNCIGDFLAGRAAKNFAKCEAALDDLLHYAKLAHWRTHLKLTVKGHIWKLRLALSKQLYGLVSSLKLLSLNELPLPSREFKPSVQAASD